MTTVNSHRLITFEATKQQLVLLDGGPALGEGCMTQQLANALGYRNPRKVGRDFRRMLEPDDYVLLAGPELAKLKSLVWKIDGTERRYGVSSGRSNRSRAVLWIRLPGVLRILRHSRKPAARAFEAFLKGQPSL